MAKVVSERTPSRIDRIPEDAVRYPRFIEGSLGSSAGAYGS
jgi:hypothetical protein